MQFGARGDGSTNDSVAVQAAADRAAAEQGELLFPPGTFVVDRYILIRNGVRFVTGGGGVIRCDGQHQQSGILLAGKASGEPANVSDCLVSGLHIDCGGVAKHPTNAIRAQNPCRVTIVGNRIWNLGRGYGILLRSHEAGEEPTRDCVITRNSVVALGPPMEHPTEGHVNDGIACDAEIPKEFTGPSYWRQHYVVPVPRSAPDNCIISGNSVRGGYYGISVHGARRMRILGNVLRENMRGISCQVHARDLIVESNEIHNCISSAIHIAYGTSDVLVAKNVIKSHRARLEALLQAYVHVSRINFIANTVDSSASAQFIAYAGVHASEISFERNEIEGRVRRAFFAIESGWRSDSADPAHYGFQKGPAVDGMAATGTRHVRILENTIRARSPHPVVQLTQVGSHALEDIVVSRNRFSTANQDPLVRVTTDHLELLSEVSESDNTRLTAQ